MASPFPIAHTKWSLVFRSFSSSSQRLTTALNLVYNNNNNVTISEVLYAGDRVQFAGDATIALNGDIVARTQPFTLTEVDVITAAVDLEDIRVYRHKIRSRCYVAAQSQPYPRVEVRLSVACTLLPDTTARHCCQTLLPDNCIYYS